MLDLSLITGWAFDTEIGEHEDPSLRACGLKHGSIKLPDPLGSKEVGFDNGRTYTYFEQWLVARIESSQATVLGFEAPLNLNHMIDRETGRLRMGENTVRLVFGLPTIVELVATRLGLQRFEVNNADARHHFLGSSRGRRDELKRKTIARCQQLGWYPQDDNAADAIAMHDYARHCFRLPAIRPAGPLFKQQVGF